MTFLFLTAEVWQAAATLDGPFLAVTMGMFALVGIVFVVARIPREVKGISSDLADVPAVAALRRPRGWCTGAAVPSPPLSRRQWVNLGLVVLFSQGVQIVLVSLMIGVFFVVFGLLTVTPATAALWSGVSVNVLADWQWWGRPVALTTELLQVAGFLTAFSGFYFTVYVLTDATYRREFLDDVLGEVREALAVRAVYLAAVRPARRVADGPVAGAGPGRPGSGPAPEPDAGPAPDRRRGAAAAAVARSRGRCPTRHRRRAVGAGGLRRRPGGGDAGRRLPAAASSRGPTRRCRCPGSRPTPGACSTSAAARRRCRSRCGNDCGGAGGRRPSTSPSTRWWPPAPTVRRGRGRGSPPRCGRPTGGSTGWGGPTAWRCGTATGGWWAGSTGCGWAGASPASRCSTGSRTRRRWRSSTWCGGGAKPAGRWSTCRSRPTIWRRWAWWPCPGPSSWPGWPGCGTTPVGMVRDRLPVSRLAVSRLA